MTIGTIHVGGLDEGRTGTAVGVVIKAIRSFVSRLSFVVARQSTRQSLRDLDDDQLRDIGVTRAQARTEADRPFWK